MQYIFNRPSDLIPTDIWCNICGSYHLIEYCSKPSGVLTKNPHTMAPMNTRSGTAAQDAQAGPSNPNAHGAQPGDQLMAGTPREVSADPMEGVERRVSKVNTPEAEQNTGTVQQDSMGQDATIRSSQDALRAELAQLEARRGLRSTVYRWTATGTFLTKNIYWIIAPISQGCKIRTLCKRGAIRVPTMTPISSAIVCQTHWVDPAVVSQTEEFSALSMILTLRWEE